jgi:hypothetical protein
MLDPLFFGLTAAGAAPNSVDYRQETAACRPGGAAPSIIVHQYRGNRSVTDLVRKQYEYDLPWILGMVSDAAIVAVPVRRAVRSKTAELGHTAFIETVTCWLRCLHGYLYAKPCKICIVDSENISVSCSIRLAVPLSRQSGV